MYGRLHCQSSVNSACISYTHASPLKSYDNLRIIRARFSADNIPPSAWRISADARHLRFEIRYVSRTGDLLPTAWSQFKSQVNLTHVAIQLKTPELKQWDSQNQTAD